MFIHDKLTLWFRWPLTVTYCTEALRKPTVWRFGATSEYLATSKFMYMYVLSVKWKCYQGMQSRSWWINIKLSVELKCYRDPQLHSQWIYIKLRVELKCYRGPHSRSGWKNKVYLGFLYTVYSGNYVNCGSRILSGISVDGYSEDYLKILACS